MLYGHEFIQESFDKAASYLCIILASSTLQNDYPKVTVGNDITIC